MIEFLQSINWFSVILSILSGLAFIMFLERHKKRPIIHKMESDKWQSIDNFPKEDFFKKELIVTDGEKVDTIFCRTYNEKGELVMNGYSSYTISNKKIIAWMPLPEPPKENNER